MLGFDSSDDEEFLGFRAEDIPLRGEENDANASGESDFSFSEASEDESSEESEDKDADEDVWSQNLRNVLVNNFEKDAGPSNILPPEVKADSFLYQMFPEDLIDLIVNETNRNAEQKQRASGGQDKNWTPVNAAGVRAYLAIRILQGIKTLPSEQHYWSNNKYVKVKKVSDTMPRTRYMKMNEYLHFNDSVTAVPQGEDGHDKLHQIRPLITTRLSETFSTSYKPNRENVIDEGLIKFKGLLGFKQYMPLKPAKRGIKVWIHVDSVSHFVCQFQVYTGRPNQGQEHGLGERFVKELSRDLVNGNHHLCFDNFFSSYKLMKDLLEDNIYATATTHLNRKDFPRELKEAKLSRGESLVVAFSRPCDFESLFVLCIKRPKAPFKLGMRLVCCNTFTIQHEECLDESKWRARNSNLVD